MKPRRCDYSDLTSAQLETAVYWVMVLVERARWDGVSRVDGRGRANYRGLRNELITELVAR